MWWKRKKLERRFDELRAIALLNRLDGSGTALTQNEIDACALRKIGPLDLLAEIARLDSRFALDGQQTTYGLKEALQSTHQGGPPGSTTHRRDGAA